jgi:hypothetical protein
MGSDSDDQGIEIVVSPIQLAAILENDTVEESSSLSNRCWGAASLVGGALELVGSAALILTPEPTTITKIAGGALAIHGLDRDCSDRDGANAYNPDVSSGCRRSRSSGGGPRYCPRRLG